jgi:hypothetical protein
VPDKRQHRGRHPADLEAFSPQVQPCLRSAVSDLSWLLSRGYADKSALKLVGDRHNLIERQRIAVMRCACSDEALVRRRDHEARVEELAGGCIAIDGYNVLTTIEAALAGGVVIVGRDGCYRDMASMYGTFRQVNETRPAIGLLGEYLAEHGVADAVWYLDRPVSNSGRLKVALLETAAARGWSWRVEVVADPDAILAHIPDMVATADSVVLDRCASWFNLARAVVAARINDAFVIHTQP